VSVLTLNYTQAGFVTALTPPRPGIYYTSVAVFNALTQGFSVQNGVDQSTLAIQQAQLFGVPSTGSPTRLQPLPVNYPYGAYLGPIQSVWYESTDSVGSYPVTLGALGGLIQWTPQVTLDSADAIYVVPGTQITSVLIANASDTARTITVTGLESSSVVGSAALAGNTSVSIPLEGGTGDTVFAITADGTLTATISLFVGVPPVVGGGSVGPVTFYASLTGPGETATPGDLTQLGGFIVDDSNGDGIELSQPHTGIKFQSGGNCFLWSDLDFTIGRSPTGSDLTETIELDASAEITLNVGSSGIEVKPGGVIVGFAANDLAFFGGAIVSQGAIVGVLSAVTDANARAVMASIVNQLDRLNLILDGTT
jgi:hypothetical protein